MSKVLVQVICNTRRLFERPYSQVPTRADVVRDAAAALGYLRPSDRVVTLKIVGRAQVWPTESDLVTNWKAIDSSDTGLRLGFVNFQRVNG